MKRTAANRRNAAKSTGPRSEHGKSVSRLNALSHGLNQPTTPDAVLRDMDRLIDEAISNLGLDRQTAIDLATDVWLLGRVRTTKHRYLKKIEQALASVGSASPAEPSSISDTLTRFAKLDVYERKARSQLARRLKMLGLFSAPNRFGKTKPRRQISSQ